MNTTTNTRMESNLQLAEESSKSEVVIRPLVVWYRPEGEEVSGEVVMEEDVTGEVVRREVVNGEVVIGEVVTLGEVVKGEVVIGEVVRREVVSGEEVMGKVVLETQFFRYSTRSASKVPLR